NERLEVGLDHAAAAAEAKHEVERGLLLDVVVGEGAAVVQLLPREDEALLVRRDAFLVLDLCLDGVDGVAALHLEGDGLPRQRLHEDLHLVGQARKADGLGRGPGCPGRPDRGPAGDGEGRAVGLPRYRQAAPRPSAPATRRRRGPARGGVGGGKHGRKARVT
uniref:Uncharacterized protein n=1 Tax=Aegilops tauschii subsp. strangulata TaxID=200361 RepID=A0A453IGJ0_AEGTS